MCYPGLNTILFTKRFVPTTGHRNIAAISTKREPHKHSKENSPLCTYTFYDNAVELTLSGFFPLIPPVLTYGDGIVAAARFGAQPWALVLGPRGYCPISRADQRQDRAACCDRGDAKYRLSPGLCRLFNLSWC